MRKSIRLLVKEMSPFLWGFLPVDMEAVITHLWFGTTPGNVYKECNSFRQGKSAPVSLILLRDFKYSHGHSHTKMTPSHLLSFWPFYWVHLGSSCLDPSTSKIQRCWFPGFWFGLFRPQVLLWSLEITVSGLQGVLDPGIWFEPGSNPEWNTTTGKGIRQITESYKSACPTQGGGGRWEREREGESEKAEEKELTRMHPSKSFSRWIITLSVNYTCCYSLAFMIYVSFYCSCCQFLDVITLLPSSLSSERGMVNELCKTRKHLLTFVSTATARFALPVFKAPCAYISEIFLWVKL